MSASQRISLSPVAYFFLAFFLTIQIAFLAPLKTHANSELEYLRCIDANPAHTMLAKRFEILGPKGGPFRAFYTFRFQGPGAGDSATELIELGHKHRCAIASSPTVAKCFENPLDSRDGTNSYVSAHLVEETRIDAISGQIERYQEIVVHAYTESTRILAREGSNHVTNDGRLILRFLPSHCETRLTGTTKSF